MPFYGPDEPSGTIFLERTFLAGDFITGMTFGILLCMYPACMQLLWKQRRTRRFSKFLMTYLTVLFIILVIFSAVSAGSVQTIYIDNRNYPGGPWSFFLASQNLAIDVIFIATFFLLTFFADSLIFWRCWIIWSASRRRTAIIGTFFPALVLLASFAIGTIWVLQSSQPGLSFYSKIPRAFGVIYYSLSIGMNVVLTLLITGKLLVYRHRFKTTSTSGSPDPVQFYTSLLTIFIESAALYSTFAICFLVSYAINNPINQVFLVFTTAAQQISAYLIAYRLAAGTAWQKDTLQKKIISSLKFNVHLQRPPATPSSSGAAASIAFATVNPTDGTTSSSGAATESSVASVKETKETV